MKKVALTIPINAPSEKIIQAFLNEQMLYEWWNVERSLIEKRIGGVYTLAWNITEKGFGYISTGIIKNYEPGSILEIDHLVYLNPERALLGPMTLTIKVSENNGGTALYLCQAGYQDGADWDWYYNAVVEAWPVVAKTLKDFLEKKINE